MRAMASASPYRNAGLTHRGERRKVLVRARLRGHGAPVDVCIRDVSTRGMLIQAGNPPLPGGIIEVGGGGLPIVGQVVWAKDRRFGVSTRETLYPESFVEDFGNPNAPYRGASAATRTRAGWRSKGKKAGYDGSRAAGGLMQYAAAVLLFVTAAGGIAWVLHDTLMNTVRSVTNAS